MVELSIALGLMAVLIGVVSAGSGMMTKTRLNREVRTVDSLRLAAQNYLSGKNLTYTGISVEVLKAAGLLPATFDPVKSNAFGGDYAVTVNEDDSTKVDIALANIPENVGEDMSDVFKGKAESTSYDRAGKSWKATF